MDAPSDAPMRVASMFFGAGLAHTADEINASASSHFAFTTTDATHCDSDSETSSPRDAHGWRPCFQLVRLGNA